MNLQYLREQMGQAAREAGAFISAQRLSFQEGEVRSKSFNQLVSYVDETAERMIGERLQALLPEAGFITEEQTRSEGNQELKWIIDPLDGTTNFIHAVPVYSVSIALARGQQLLAGVVYECSRQELFSASLGEGAYLDGERIQVKQSEQLAHTLMATGFPYYDFAEMEQYLAVLRQLMQQTRGLRRMGSAAVDLAYVACGRFDGFFELSLSPWDVAAGALLVQEAGGQVCDFKGGPDYVFGRSIIAASSAIHPQLLALIRQHFTG